MNTYTHPMGASAHVFAGNAAYKQNFEEQALTAKMPPSISQILARILLLTGNLVAGEITSLTAASQRMGVPLGRVLVMCCRLKEEELAITLTAARLVQLRQLSTGEAAILTAYCLHYRLPFENIWQRYSYRLSNAVTLLLTTSGRLPLARLENFCARTKPHDTNKITGAELFEAGLITIDQWREAVETALQIKEQSLTTRVLLCDDSEITGQHPVYVEPASPANFEDECALLKAFEDSLTSKKNQTEIRLQIAQRLHL
jgi:hypothetical protein